MGGYFIPYKSCKIQEELKMGEKAIFLLGGEMMKKEDFELPDSDISRCLLQIKKVKNTPSNYPRKAGMPTKEPLF